MNTFFQRLQKVREMMQDKGWDAIVITSSDPHSSECPGSRWKQVKWLTGFAGECGDVVITKDHAGVWTDTRFFIQVSKDLPGTGYELHKTRVPEQVLIPEWLAAHAFAENEGQVVVAVDGLAHTLVAVNKIKNAFEQEGRVEGEKENGYRIINAPDMLDALWEDRPAIPTSPIITISSELTGESRQDKILWLRKFLIDNKCDAILLTALDEIAWMLNARGADIAYSPVSYSHMLVSLDDVNWYVLKSQHSHADSESQASFEELRKDGVKIQQYADIDIALASLKDDPAVKKLYVDPATLNYNLYSVLVNNLPQGSIRFGESPVQLRKSIKNPVELQCVKDAHIEEGIAMERFYFWLENQLASGTTVTEWDCVLKLRYYRSQIPGYMGDGFATTSAYGPAAALPHYVTPQENAPVLERHGLYLCDTGGHYLYGTTDTTRTIPCGPCTELEKQDYTLVLMCHIDLASAIFPKGTCGCHLDILVRNALWQRKMNFGHGSGHGVGTFLNVHEGPQEFRQNFNSYPYIPGIVNTNEPGLYREGMHGVRHESTFVVEDAGTNEFGTWYKFNTITRCHIDTTPVKKELMSEFEIKWLNDYNRTVYETLAPRLEPEIAKWLENKCKPI